MSDVSAIPRFSSVTKAPVSHKHDFRSPQISIHFQVVNLSDQYVVITDRSNLTYSVPPQQGEQNKGVILIRKVVEFNAGSLHENSLSQLEHLVARQGFDTIESRAMREALTAKVNAMVSSLGRRCFYIDYELPLTSMQECGAVHHIESDLIVSTGNEAHSHPDSEYGRRIAHTQGAFAARSVSGMTVEIIDNQNAHGPRYVMMAGQVVEIRPVRDTSRPHGVHVTTMETNALGDLIPVVKILTMEEAQKEYGMFVTREDAANWGRVDLRMANELEEAKRARALMEAEIEAERLEMKRDQERRDAAHREQLRVAELRHLDTKHTIETSRTKEEIKLDRKRKKTDLEHDKKKKNSDRKHDRNVKSMKEYYETRAAERGDVSSFFKSIPGMITGVVALTAIGVGVGKWLAGGAAAIGGFVSGFASIF